MSALLTKFAKKKTAVPVLRTGLVGVLTENRIQGVLEARPDRTHLAVRWPITFGNDVSAVRAILDNFILTSGGLWYDNTNSFAVQSLYLEIGSTLTQLTFGGNSGITIAPAASNIESDLIPLIATRGTQGWLRAIVSVAAAGELIPAPNGRTTANLTGSQVLWFDPAVTTMSAVNASGTFTWTGTTPTTRPSGFCPMIVGVRTDTQPVFGVVGDSIAEGALGDTGASAGRGGVGYIQRAAYNGNVNPISVVNLARSGVQLIPFIGADLRWRTKMQYMDHMICELGTNFIGTGGTGSYAQLRTDLTTLWNIYKAAGIQRIIRSELTPRATTSGDSYITTAGQTVNPGWQTGQQSQQINAYCATRVGQELHSIVTMESIRDAADPTRWAVNGTANYSTPDGTHISPAGNALAAINMRKCFESHLA